MDAVSLTNLFDVTRALPSAMRDPLRSVMVSRGMGTVLH